MWPIVLLVVIGAGEEAVRGRIIQEVLYTEHPIQEYYPTEKYFVQVPEHSKYFYDHAPAYYHSDIKLTEDIYDSDGLKKTIDDAHENARKSVKGDKGHYIVTDTEKKHGYVGIHAAESVVEGKASSEKSNEQDTSSGSGYREKGNEGYDKGHKTSVFHKSYYKEESGKDHRYFDKDHKSGEENFGKTNDELLGEAGREKYAIANSGAGHKYYLAGGGDHGAGLRSSVDHDSIYGHHGRHGSYYNRDAALRNDLAGAYHRGIHNGGHSFGHYEPIY